MVQASDKVMCLEFVDGGEDLVTTIVIRTYQMEGNFLHFDLATSSLGFSYSSLFQRTTCSKISHLLNEEWKCNESTFQMTDLESEALTITMP
ncbi:hypothetical protein SUGI_0184690 [Cryptomeria japonica]|nr:hypothetical protein SUGI_0184690 [Cryptomeria japonica]